MTPSAKPLRWREAEYEGWQVVTIKGQDYYLNESNGAYLDASGKRKVGKHFEVTVGDDWDTVQDFLTRDEAEAFVRRALTDTPAPASNDRVGQVPDVRDVGKTFMFIGVDTRGRPSSAAGKITRVQFATVNTPKKDKRVVYVSFTRYGREGEFQISVRGNDWDKGAKITEPVVDDPKLQRAIDTAIDHIGINQAVIKPEARTDFIITRDAKGDYHVYNEDAWEESEGALLPWSPPTGEPIGRVNHKTGSYSAIQPGKGPVIKNLPAKPAEVEPVGKALPSDRANFAQNIAHEFAEDLYGNGYGYSSVDHSWSKKVGEYRFVITFDRDKNHPERKYRMDIVQPDGERSVGFYGRDADGFRADIPRFENEAEKMSKRVNAQPPDTSYRMTHTSPDHESGGAAFDIESIMPDFYAHPEYYKTGDDKADAESIRALKKIKGDPHAMVTIYRGVPDVEAGINPNDWVSLSPTYAKQHGMHATDESQDWPVVSMQVPAYTLFTAGDLNEFGYDPRAPRPPKPRATTTDRRKVTAALAKASANKVTIVKNSDGKPTNFQVDLDFENEEERDAFIAAAPKALGLRKVKAWNEDGTSTPTVMLNASFTANGVNGGDNERGIKRALQIIELLKEAGISINESTAYSNRMTVDEFIKAVT